MDSVSEKPQKVCDLDKNADMGSPVTMGCVCETDNKLRMLHFVTAGPIPTRHNSALENGHDEDACILCCRGFDAKCRRIILHATKQWNPSSRGN